MKLQTITTLLCIVLSMPFVHAQNSALRFNGSGDYVSCGNISGFSTALTIEAWIYPQAIADQTYAPIVKSSDEFALEIDHNNNNVTFFVKVNGSWQNSLAYEISTLNTWYHIAGTYDGSTVRLYVVGNEIGSGNAVGGSISATATNVEIGRDPSNTNRFFNGIIDEVRIWSVARTQQQIKDNMLLELNGNETGLTAYYDMNEGSGTILHNKSKTTSGNFNGTINGASWTTGPDFPLMLTYDIPDNNYMIDLPLYGSPMNVTVDWGDGSSTENVTTPGGKTHIYSTAGVYTVKVTGSLITFGNDSLENASTGIGTLTSVQSFGNIGITNLNAAFNSAANLISVPAKLPITVSSLDACFVYASGFNQDISAWDVSNVTTMNNLFDGATSFDQNLGAWDVSNVTIMSNMFKDVTLSPANYNALLKGWSQLTLQSGVNFHAGNSKYTGVAVAARTNIDVDQQWTITDGGQTPITWGGSGSYNWNTTANWAEGIIPVRNDDVVIANEGISPVIENEEPVDCRNLIVNSNASLTINYGGSLINHDSLSVEATITNNGTITMNQTLTGSAQAWHLISGPAVADISDNGWNPTLGEDDLYAWHEANPGTWVNYHVTAGDLNFPAENGSDNFVAGKGYLAAYNAVNPAKSIVGTPNAGDIDFSLKNTAVKSWTYNNGWNLLGNPYPSAIDWNLVDHNEETSIFQDVFAYVYDPNKSGGEDYVTIDGSSPNAFIAPFQGFFVLAKTSSNNTNFTFTNAMRAHGGGFLKNQSAGDGLTLRLSTNDWYNETGIRLREESEFSRDRLDALKMFSFNPQIPQLYSISDDGVALAMNSIPQIEAEKAIPLGMKLAQEGAFTISLQQSDLDMASAGIYLEDRALGIFTKLSESAYTFQGEAGDVSGRFYLHFGMVDIGEQGIESSFNIVHQGDKLVLFGAEAYGFVQLFDLQGRIIFSGRLNGEAVQYLDTPYRSGVYLITVNNSIDTATRKVVVL
jgi:surface protein